MKYLINYLDTFMGVITQLVILLVLTLILFLYGLIIFIWHFKLTKSVYNFFDFNSKIFQTILNDRMPITLILFLIFFVPINNE